MSGVQDGPSLKAAEVRRRAWCRYPERTERSEGSGGGTHGRGLKRPAAEGQSWGGCWDSDLKRGGAC